MLKNGGARGVYFGDPHPAFFDETFLESSAELESDKLLKVKDVACGWQHVIVLAE